MTGAGPASDSQPGEGRASSRVLVDGLEFPEGPTFDSSGTLFVVETGAGRITAIGPGGDKWTHATPGGGPNGLVLGPGGCLFCANNGGFTWNGSEPDFSSGYDYGRIERLDPDGTVTVLYRDGPDRPLDAPDDITIDREGWVWFTDPGHGDLKTPRGRLYVAAPDGSDIREVGAGYHFPNGLAFTPDFSELIVGETGTGWLLVHEVMPDRSLGPRRELVRLPRGSKPDGMCLDDEGNILVAGSFGATVYAYSASAAELDRFTFDDPYVTNLCFGGPAHSDLFVTLGSKGRVDVVPWQGPGLVLPFLER